MRVVTTHKYRNWRRSELPHALCDWGSMLNMNNKRTKVGFVKLLTAKCCSLQLSPCGLMIKAFISD